MANGFVIFFLPLVVCALAWLYLGISTEVESDQSRLIEDKLNALLPQTQCGKCEYDGCRPYAHAMANDEADINRCPPGGKETIKLIAGLLGRDTRPLDSDLVPATRKEVALIDEDICIGCFKCIRACPVDAIVGAPKYMHTVIEKICTGCELCIPPCPVNCISMTPVHVEIKKWVWIKPEQQHEVRV